MNQIQLRHILLNLSVVLALVGVSFRPAIDPAPLKLTIMSYNVRNGIGMNSKRDYDRVAAVIRAHKPGIVAIQELDSAAQRSGQADVLKEIAIRAGYQYVYAPAIDFDGGKYGIGMLSIEKPQKSWLVPLPGREEERVLQVVEFAKYMVFNVHFSLTEADRISSVAIINAERAKCSKPVFLAGDFNAQPLSTEIGLLKQNGWLQLSGDVPGFPADKPGSCIDYIFSSVKCKVKSSSVPDSPNAAMASDHRPVLVRIKEIR